MEKNSSKGIEDKKIQEGNVVVINERSKGAPGMPGNVKPTSASDGFWFR